MEKAERNYEEEYRMLRAEIVNCISLQNTLSTFMVTAVTALLALAFTNMNPWLFLLPYMVILPIGCGIFHYRSNVLKLASYLIVFLEPHLPGMNWEGRHNRYTLEKDGDRFYIFRNYLSLFLSVVVYLLFLYSYLPTVGAWAVGPVLAALAPLLPTGYMLFLTCWTSRAFSSRKPFIRQWQAVKEAEDAQAHPR